MVQRSGSTLLGPGPASLTVARGSDPQLDCFRIFYLNDSDIAWISGLTISNGCDYDGGGVNNTGNAVLSNCVVTANTAFGSEGGAGIYNECELLIVDSSIVGNMATNNARGGGIYTVGDLLVVINSLIAGNSSQRGGGGLYVSGSDVTLTNVSFSGNSATNGGGIYLRSFGDFVAASVTIASNIAYVAGGGIFDEDNGDAELKNVIVAGNTAPSGPDVGGELVSLGHNLLGDGTATIEGEVRSRANPNKCFHVEFQLTGRTSIAPPDSPKLQLCDDAYVNRGGPVDPSTWRYYTGLTGVLTGVGSYAGAVVNVTRVGPAFQVGDGASGKNSTFGASAWFTWIVATQPKSGLLPRTGQGDINIDLFECCEGEGCDDEGGGGPFRVFAAPDCLAHYSFEEPFGTNALDSSGSGNHGFLLNGPVRSNGIAGKALRFDGSNDRVVAANPASLNITGAVTIAAWVRPESVSGSRYILIKGNASNTKYSYSLRASDAKVQYRWVSPNGSENKFGSSSSVLSEGR